MNEFTAKKLGEVMAFAEVSIDTFEKGREALVSVLSSDMVETVVSECQMHIDTIKKIAEQAGQSAVTLKKAEATILKLRAMRELYIGEQWDNPTELLEWSGFFEGAAVVHWALVRGCAEQTENNDLIELSLSATNLHHKILHNAGELLTEVGKKKSQG
jgi:hypothetical protein